VSDIGRRAFADELYVSNFNSGVISKVDTAAGTVTPFASGLTNPLGVAFNKSGDLFVTIRSSNMKRVTPDGGVHDFGPSYPDYIMSGAAVDSAGNVYASGIHPAGTFIASIFKLSPAGALLSTWSWSPGNGPLQPTAMVFDNAGDLFTTDYSGNKLWKVSSAGAASLITPLAVNPQGIALDSLGELLVSLTSSGSVAKVTQTGDISGFASGLNAPAGVAFDSLGNLFVATGTTLTKLKPDGLADLPITGLDSAQFIANRSTDVPEPSALELCALGGFLIYSARGRTSERALEVA
jgi:sugar lactone lactonase YvrE